MAREFLKIDEWEDWVPPLDGERDLYRHEPDEALVMELRFLSKEQREHYQRISEKFQRLGAAASRSDVRSMRQMFVDNVRNVRNYTVDGAPVTTGAELFDVNGDVLLIVAVTEALTLRSTLDRGLSKKLRSGSGITHSRRIPASDGGVPDATPPSTPTIPAASEKRETCDFQTPPSAGTEVVIGGPKQSSTTGPESTTSEGARRAS
jgi:hypothetical protein